jgi:hypothetical protein
MDLTQPRTASRQNIQGQPTVYLRRTPGMRQTQIVIVEDSLQRFNPLSGRGKLLVNSHPARCSRWYTALAQGKTRRPLAVSLVSLSRGRVLCRWPIPSTVPTLFH